MNTNPEIVTSLPLYEESVINKKSLLQQIKAAKTETEVNLLLNIGSTYKKVSDKTKRKWLQESSIKVKSFITK